MWDELDQLISDALDPVMGERFHFQPMLAAVNAGAVPDPQRGSISDIVGILDFAAETERPQAGIGREARFKGHVLARRAELSVDARQFGPEVPREGDVLRQADGRVWQISEVWRDGARYELRLKRLT